MADQRLFISYRRTDSEYIAGRIWKKLVEVFGKEAIFFDVGGSIVPGSQFPAEIKQAIDQSRVMLVVIGDIWLTATDESGIPRLQNPKDWVRKEVERGLKNPFCDVIPVMVAGGSLDEKYLPGELKKLVPLQWQKVRSDPDFEKDLEGLIEVLENEYQFQRVEKEHPQEPVPPTAAQIDFGGDVTIGGDVVAGDKNVSAGERGIAIGGNVSDSTLITGDHNVVESTQIIYRQELIREVNRKIDQDPDLSPDEKSDIKSDLKEIEEEDREGKTDESWFGKRLRNIKRMSPDIGEVVLACILDPKAGFGVAVKKIAEKIKQGNAGAASEAS